MAECSSCRASWLGQRAGLPMQQYEPSSCRSADLLSLRLDLRVLRLDQGDQVVVGQAEQGGAVHPSPVGDPTVTVSRGISQPGLSSYLYAAPSVLYVKLKKEDRTRHIVS